MTLAGSLTPLVGVTAPPDPEALSVQGHNGAHGVL